MHSHTVGTRSRTLTQGQKACSIRRVSSCGFYSSANPDVDHPRWSQATERRVGGEGLFAKEHKTLMFNGSQVLKKNY